MSLDPNQRSGEETCNPEPESPPWLRAGPSELSPRAGHSWTRMFIQGTHATHVPLAQRTKIQSALSIWGCSLITPISREKEGKKKSYPSRGAFWTQCQPETAADVEQRRGPTVPSCPSSAATEKTVKRPGAGGQPARTKELTAGKTTCALSNSSQNNPLPRVWLRSKGENPITGLRSMGEEGYSGVH